MLCHVLLRNLPPMLGNGIGRCLVTCLLARKRRVLARINGVQKALSNGPSHFLVHLEQDLLKEYSEIRSQEEEYWALKSRLNWAAYGDRNT